MKTFFIFFFGIWTLGFAAGVLASNSATEAAQRVVDNRTASYCEAGLTEFCK